uniref:RING finger protein 17 isoform X1 n=1 Tax=Pogona vitticeps TaxID=103695 RepID=A0ABM5FWJ1_9SAUR
MASFSDFLESRRGKTQRKSPFEGFRQRGRSIRRVASDLYFQNSSSCEDNDGYISKVTWDFEQKVRYKSLQRCKQTGNYNKSIKEESKQNDSPDWIPPHCLFSEIPTADMDSRTLQNIEKALEVAEINLKQLKAMEDILQELVAEAKLEEGRIAGVINAKFAEIVTSLNARKRKLETELVTNTSYYVTAVHGVQVSVSQKRSSLDGAIKVVKQMMSNRSLKSCDNLYQVIRDLQMTIEEQVLKLDNLKKRSLPCFVMDCDEITPFFENMGKFFFDIPNRHCFGDGPLKLNIMEEEIENSASTEINVELQSVAEETPVVASLRKSDPCFEESYNEFQEITLSSTHKWIASSPPQTTSSPDVIIEEIFEDYQEKSSEDTQWKTKLPVPLGSKTESPELVVVSCVVNPCHFYVRKVSQKKTEVHLERILRQFCHKKSSSPSDVLELGTRIFVRSKEHEMWCRAEIIQLIPLENTNEGKPCGPTKYKICDIAMMRVFLIDYGHPEALIVSGVPNEDIMNPEHVTSKYIVTEDLCMVVRKPDLLIETQLRGIRKLALHCSLKDIVPKNAAEGWKSEARTEFLRMINNKAVLMKVFREENGVLIVDLLKPAANKISSDMPVSLRDALVFLDLARFRIELPDQSERNIPLQYFPPVMPQENAEVLAVVSYINSPDDFYIQLLENGPEFAAFLSKVEEVYKNQRGASFEIICPVPGQPCVAKFDTDGIWYRAQVIGLLGHQEVEVKYVDFGNTATINVDRMRKIKDEFLALPAKAIRCKLAHIAPCKGTEEWSSKSKVRFEELIQDKCMLCFVEEMSEDGILSVELYDTMDTTTKLSSVNNILVEENLASYMKSSTKMTTRFHNEVWDPALEEILKKGRDVLQPENKVFSEFEDLELDCNKELQVRINQVVSPNKIFVQFMSSEKILKSLQERMTATYSGSESETVQWTVDMKCAAYERDLNQWQRGQICKIVSEKVVEVFLFDLGVAKMVDTAYLRELKEDLKTLRPLSVECFLDDIRPAGGTEQWTATACDALAGYLTGALVTLIIQENNSFPLSVKILSKDGGMCTDISEYMIKEGLALRKGRPTETDSSTTSSSKLPEIPFEQKDSDINNLLTKTECAPVLSVPEKEVDPLQKVTESKEEEFKMPVSQPMTEAYKPPALPSSDTFTAIVSCVSEDGTIYVIPKSQEQQRRELMNDIQNNFKCLGLLKPYSWKTGEACVVRAADTMWYRGKVREVGIGIIKVQYLDYGYIEKIPQCHLYPTVLYADIPPFSIPCELSKVVPVGNVWQQDAVELLQELLAERLVEIQIMERLDNPWGNVSIELIFAGMSLSSFMAYHKHCVSEDDDASILKLGIADCSEYPLEENCDISHEELVLAEIETTVLPSYSSPSLPALEHLFPVEVTHVVSPNEIYIAIAHSDNANQHDDTEDRRTECNSKTLKEMLKYYNENTASLSFLTDFRTGMPCLAQYRGGLWHRAKVLSVKKFHPLLIVVKFVDYGSTGTVPTSRLRQIPLVLMQYPARAFRVLLAGFRPALSDPASERVPYCPEWTMDALWEFISLIEGKKLCASTVTYSPEHTVFLYEDGNLIHIRLVEMGLAELS